MTLAELAEDLGYLQPDRLEWIGNTISGPQDIQSVVTGDVDFGLAFNGAIVKLRAVGAPIVAVIASNGVDAQSWNGYYVLENSPILKGSDLIGKTVAMNTLGAHTELMLREYLRREGVVDDDARRVAMVAVPPVSCEQALRDHQVDVAVLGSVFRDKAIERGGLRRLFFDYELYGTFSSASYVFRTEFVRSHRSTVGRFVEGTARAIEWARATPRGDVIAHLSNILNHRKRNEDASLLRYWRGVSIHAPGGRLFDADFDMWIGWLTTRRELLGPPPRASDMYTNEFNPFPELDH